MRITSNVGIRGIRLTSIRVGNILSGNILLHSGALCGTDSLYDLWCLFSNIFLFCNLGAKCLWDGGERLSVYRVHALTRTIQPRQVTTWEPTLVERGMPSLKIIYFYRLILKVNEDRFFMVPRIPLLNHWMKVKGIILATFGQIFTKLSDVYWGTLCLSWHQMRGQIFNIWESCCVRMSRLKWLLRLFILT